MLRKKTLRHCILLLTIFLAVESHAAKFDFYFGAFDFSAKTDSNEGSASGLGLYKINYSLPILNNLEAGLGYTVILSNTVSGDALFGFDIEVSYFPLTAAGPLKIQTENTQAIAEALWRPFVMLGYAARQIQSVSTQYNGVSLGAGVERALDKKFNFKGLVRYSTMAGPNEGEATELGMMGGISFNF
jgi:hypothetical protein